MWFNQQLTQEQSKDFYNKLVNIIEDWLPYSTTYPELKNIGWHKKYKESNKYVSSNEDGYIKAWDKFPKKKELIKLINDFEPLNTKSALQVLKEVTGIDGIN